MQWVHDRPGEAFPSTSPRTFLKRIQVKERENDLFQFFPVNIHVYPCCAPAFAATLDSLADTPRSYSHSATVSRDCARNDESCHPNSARWEVTSMRREQKQESRIDTRPS